MSGLVPWRTTKVLLVVFYLCVAGWFFVLAPWSRFWTTQVVTGAPSWLYPLLDSPTLRGALSGFGVLHFSAAASWLAAGARQS